jgi:ribosomal protein L11 methyltransferase
VKLYPALDVCASSSDAVLAMVDDFSPSALEERETAMRLFFASADARDAACAELRARGLETAPLEVSDEDWARRSQENLQPITVGRITVVSDASLKSRVRDEPSGTSHDAVTPAEEPPIVIVIAPSMGFGTGHHATTRLCLDALQRLDITGRSVLDVGTGSGILAIAASRLGAARVTGIDVDPDAVQAARENLDHNPGVLDVEFNVVDLSARVLPQADVVTANLTGSMLVASAAVLCAAVRPGGALILSGILAGERDDLLDAFGRDSVAWQKQDGDWIGFMVTR